MGQKSGVLGERRSQKWTAAARVHPTLPKSDRRLVSGVIAAGLPRRLVDAAKAGELELCISEMLLAELRDVLSRGKFAGRLAQAELTPLGIVDDLRLLALVVSPTDRPRVLPTDPDDDHVLAAAHAAALAGQADLIGSGDKRDLLPLGSCRGLDIVTSRQAVDRLAARRKTQDLTPVRPTRPDPGATQDLTPVPCPGAPPDPGAPGSHTVPGLKRAIAPL